MATFVYNKGTTEIANGGIDLLTDTLKMMLVTSSYVADRDDDFIEEGVDDANEHEIVVSGYTGGFGGAGRKTLGTKTVTEDDANDRVEFDIANITWTALGVGATIAGAIIVKEITNDLASILIAYLDIADTPTNGGDVTLDINADGVIQISTV
ncbi:hypothetical protein LCGC14_0987980 [marine sediment metagenome]|uniref:Uncharacterized protein n=1 Tax=marine sediment metagenome TaxID=412755 RepID=A0A0F9RDA7_9ZZZZ